MAYHFSEYRGWTITNDGGPDARWLARKEFSDGGHKLRADSKQGLKEMIREYVA